MVPFPDPGAPTIRAQILPLLAAVEEFRLEEEALEEGDPHQKTPLQRGGRRTRDVSMAEIQKGEKAGSRRGPVEGEQ